MKQNFLTLAGNTLAIVSALAITADGVLAEDRREDRSERSSYSQSYSRPDRGSISRRDINDESRSEQSAGREQYSNRDRRSDDAPRASMGKNISDEQDRDSNISVQTDVRSNRDISVSDRRAISAAAERLLVHVEKARSGLQSDNNQKASQHIDKALTLARIIEDNAPTYTVKTTISSGDQTYTDESEINMVPVPVYSTIGQVSMVGPVVRAKQEASRSSDSSSANQTGVVKDAELFATRIDLDVAMAKEHLQAAQQKLDQGNEDAALAALSAVQRGVILTYGEADMPLVRAQQNLALAKVRAQAGDTEEAQRALKAASNALELYEERVGQSRARDLQSIRKEIASAASSNNSSKDSKNLAGQIEDWQSALEDV